MRRSRTQGGTVGDGTAADAPGRVGIAAELALSLGSGGRGVMHAFYGGLLAALYHHSASTGVLSAPRSDGEYEQAELELRLVGRMAVTAASAALVNGLGALPEVDSPLVCGRLDADDGERGTTASPPLLHFLSTSSLFCCA
eukprot:COSAG05_NODE_1617_length_4393_cov_5.095249_4_plen_141_part_00